MEQLAEMALAEAERLFWETAKQADVLRHTQPQRGEPIMHGEQEVLDQTEKLLANFINFLSTVPLPETNTWSRLHAYIRALGLETAEPWVALSDWVNAHKPWG